MAPHLEGSHLGSYRLIRQLGEGGMGAVYEAVHEGIGRQVAIKVLHPEFSVRPDILKRFFNEARAVNLIDHPGLVQIFDYGQTPERTAYIVMELLRGEPLSKRIKQRGAMPCAEVFPIAMQTASALAAAHAKRIIHRDLKPENIMLVPDSEHPGHERSKLLDFGIAKLAEDASSGSDKTRTNALMGTPPYMSPEQCQGAGRVDDRSDVYSLGIMLYEMLAGRRPFIGEGIGPYIIQHMTEPPPPLRGLAPGVSESVAVLVHQMLAKQKERRPGMQEVLDELRRLAGATSAKVVPILQLSWLGSAIEILRGRPAKDATLEYSSGESAIGRPRHRRWSALVATLSIPVALASSAGVHRLRLRQAASQVHVDSVNAAQRPQPVAPSSVSATTPTSSLPSPEPAGVPLATVEWRITTEPAGVQVIHKDSGEIIGTTPILLRRTMQPGTVQVLLGRAGYQAAQVTLAGDADSSVEKHLLPLKQAVTTRRPNQNSLAPTAQPAASLVVREPPSVSIESAKDNKDATLHAKDLLEN